MDNYDPEPIDGELVPDDASPFDTFFPPPRGPRPAAQVGETYAAPTLGQLLVQYNSMLGWTQSDLAKAMGKDAAEVSRIVTGRHRKPQDFTLEAIAETYQRAGLSGVTKELLTTARDSQDRPVTNPWGLPPVWLRLVQSILALDLETQDALYRVISTLVREVSMIKARKVDE